MAASIVFLAGAVALSILSLGDSRDRARLRSEADDPCAMTTAEDSSPATFPITFRAVAPPRVFASEPIPITLILTNHSDRKMPIAIAGDYHSLRQMPFDIRIERVSDGTRVWSRWGGTFMWSDVGAVVDTLAAGDSLVFADRWTQRMKNGEFVTPGTYCIRGQIAASPMDGRPHNKWIESEIALVTIVVGNR